MINPPCHPHDLEDLMAKLDRQGQQFLADVVSELDRIKNGDAPRPPEAIGHEINVVRTKLDKEDQAILDDIVLELVVRRSEYY